MVQNAIENGINVKLFKSGFFIELNNMANKVKTIGPIIAMFAVSFSVGSAYFFPILFLGKVVNSGEIIPEKNNFPLENNAMNNGKIIPHCMLVF